MFWIWLAIGRGLAIPISMKFSAEAMMKANCVGCLIAMIVLISGTHSMTAVWIGSAIYGIAMASQFPSAMVLCEQYLGEISGKAASLLVIGAAIGDMVIPLIVSALFLWSYWTFIYSITVTTLIATVMFVLLRWAGAQPGKDGKVVMKGEKNIVHENGFTAMSVETIETTKTTDDLITENNNDQEESVNTRYEHNAPERFSVGFTDEPNPFEQDELSQVQL